MQVMMKQKLMAGALVAVMATSLTGCEWMSEHRTATGAGIGTVAGAAAGAAIGRDAEGALIGAAAGAALGGGIGYILQRQKDAFDRIEEVEARQTTVNLPPVSPSAPPQQAQAVTVTIGSEVLFDQGSSALTAHGVQKLREVAQVMNQEPNSQIYVMGYTSSEGADQFNMELSQSRANVVKNQLIAYGVAPGRIHALGMGESNPVATNETEAGRMRNRRVEIHVVPQGGGAQGGYQQAPPQQNYPPQQGGYPPPSQQY